MWLEVRLFAGLRVGRFNKRTLELPDELCVRDLLRQLEIPAKHVSLRLVNGHYSPGDHALRDGDVVSLFPAIGGG